MLLLAWNESVFELEVFRPLMDVGKSLCCLYGKQIVFVDELRTMIAEKNYGEITAKWIGVPTTAATGKYVSRNCCYRHEV